MEQNMKDQIEQIDKKVSLMYYALMGNDMTKDGGLIKRIDTMENRMTKQDEKINHNTQELEKKNIYTNLLWLFAGAVCVFIIERLLTNL